jgi:hypothetical protein
MEALTLFNITKASLAFSNFAVTLSVPPCFVEYTSQGDKGLHFWQWC